jgi:single-stranded-DNA-specific exonuclease
VPQLRESLARIAAEQISLASAPEALPCDLELRFAGITPDLLSAFEQLGPFGLGNPDPLFLTRRARLATPPRPINDHHLRLCFEDHDGSARFSGVAWARRTSWADRAREQAWAQGDLFDLAYRLHRNWHPDFGGWELEIVALDRRPQEPTGTYFDTPVMRS